MVLNYKDMILTTLISSKFLKVCFIYGLSMTGMVFIEQQLTEMDLFLQVINSTPSIVISSFGVVWIGAKMVKAIMDALKSISDAWLHHESNKIKLKENKEHLERNEMDTEIKRDTMKK